MDALEALGDHGAHALKQGALRGPITARAGAVHLARDDDERHAGALVVLGGVVHAHDLTGELVERDGAATAGEVVLELDVGEGAARHALVVAAP